MIFEVLWRARAASRSARNSVPGTSGAWIGDAPHRGDEVRHEPRRSPRPRGTAWPRALRTSFTADPSVSLGSPSGLLSGWRRSTWCSERDVRPRAARRRQQRIVRGHDAFGVPSGVLPPTGAPKGLSPCCLPPGAAGYDVCRSVTGIGGTEPDDHGVARASVSVLARLVGWFGDRLCVRHRADAG